MGNSCCSERSVPREFQEELPASTQWHYKESYLDYYTFKKTVNNAHYEVVQKEFSAHYYNNLPKLKAKQDIQSTIKYFAPMVCTGIPFDSMKVLLKVIFESKPPTCDYSVLQASYQHEKEPVFAIPYYGARTFENTGLQIQGVSAAKSVVHTSGCHNRQIKMAPNVFKFVQLLLWYYKEDHTFDILQKTMAIRDTHFSETFYDWYTTIMGMQSHLSFTYGQHLTMIDQNMLWKLCVEAYESIGTMFLAPEFYGLALVRFIWEGVGFIMFILKLVIMEVIPSIPEIECIEQIARISRTRLKLKSLTAQPIPVKLPSFGQSSVPFKAKFEYFIDSTIAASEGLKQDLIQIMPQKFINWVPKTILSEPGGISEISAAIQSTQRPFIMLIETTKNEVFGFLLDRPIQQANEALKKSTSFVFRLASVGRPQKHDHLTGEDLRVKFGREHGIQIGGVGKEDIAIQITPDLEIGKSGSCTVFDSRQLTKEGSFAIKNIEIIDLNITK